MHAWCSPLPGRDHLRGYDSWRGPGQGGGHTASEQQPTAQSVERGALGLATSLGLDRIHRSAAPVLWPFPTPSGF